MQVSLPPRTQSYAPLGKITFKLFPLYLNTSLPSVKYSLKLWGFSQNMVLQSVNEQDRRIQKNNKQTHYQKVFAVTTNLCKLTQYFRDMAVLIIIVSDPRTHRQVGTGFVKIRNYIINQTLSQFQQKIQIGLPQLSKKNNNSSQQPVLGEVILKLQLDVPLHSPPIPRQLPKQLPTVTNLANQIAIPCRKKSSNKISQYAGKSQLQEPQKIFPVYQEPLINYQKDQNQMKDLLAALHTKPKVTANNVLDFIQQDSIKNYPDLSDLHRKYGRSNVNAERMRLKLDQAKYLNPIKQIQHMYNQREQDYLTNGFVSKFKNIHFVVADTTNSAKSLSDFEMTQYVSQIDQSVVSKNLIKDLYEGGVYIKNLSSNNCLQLENKLYKGKATIRKSNIQGQPLKVIIRRKDNNKKVAQLDLLIQKINNRREQSNQKSKPYVAINRPSNKQNQSQGQRKSKLHFYISIKPLNPAFHYKQKNYGFSIHPQCQKEPVNGKKMIFTGDNAAQNVKIKVQNKKNMASNMNVSGKNGEVMVTVDSVIRMKQQVISVDNQEFKIFLASSDTIQNLMKIVVLYESNNSNSQPDSHNNSLQIERKENDEKKLSPHKSKGSLNIYQSREQKLKLLFECFQCLIQTTNSECMQLIKKLQSPSLTYDQQPPLFQKLCLHSGLPQSQSEAAAYIVFRELLHGQFSMFWSCFNQYRRWNELYWKSLKLSQKQFQTNLWQCAVDTLESNYYPSKDGNVHNKLRKVVQNSIQRLYRNKQTLFGLIPYDRCESILAQYLRDRFKCDQLDNEQYLKVQMNHSNVLSLQQRLVNKAKIQALVSSVIVILSLMCRYYGSDGQTHCLKICQLAAILLPNSEQKQPLYINQHQILAMCQLGQNQGQVQLLSEVVLSCVADRDIKNGNKEQTNNTYCSALKEILRSTEKVETQQSSKLDEEDNQIHRMNTQNQTQKIHTQQRQRIYTQEIQNNRKNTRLQSQQNVENNRIQPRSKEVRVWLVELLLNPDASKYITIQQTKHTVIQIYPNNSTSALYKIHKQQLPKCVSLSEMQDYKVVVTIYQQQPVQVQRQQIAESKGLEHVFPNKNKQAGKLVQIWKFQGIFIANNKLQRVPLFSSEKQGLSQMGYIQMSGSNKLHKMQQSQEQINNNDELVIQIKNQLHYSPDKYPSLLPPNSREQLQFNRQAQQRQLQQQRAKLTKQQYKQGKVLTNSKLSYKILSIFPMLRDNQQYLICIEGVQQVIRYPTLFVMGTIENQDSSKKHLDIYLENNPNERGDVSGAEELPKIAGTHEICFTNPDSTVKCVITIQIDEYTGHQIVENHASNGNSRSIQRVILVNIYHLTAFMKLSQVQLPGLDADNPPNTQVNEQESTYTVVMNIQSDSQPIFIQDVNPGQANGNQTNPYYSRQHTIQQYMRYLWLGVSARVQASKKYDICIYKNNVRKTNTHQGKKYKLLGHKYTEENLIAHFQFKIKYHPDQTGIFQNKGFLVDDRGYRLAINVLQINYNDVFSKDSVGRQKFEKLLNVFSTDNLVRLAKSSHYQRKQGEDTEGYISKQIKKQIRNSFGFTNTQLHLLYQLQTYQNQIADIIVNWDISVFKNQSFNMEAYSIQDLFSEYQIYDFKNCGLIAKSKAQLVNLLVFGKSDDKSKGNESKTKGINLGLCAIDKQEGWVKDLKNPQKDGNIDYILILWCLRRFAISDNFFIQGQIRAQTQNKNRPINQNDTTNKDPLQNPFKRNNHNNESISKIRAIKIQLVQYRNLKVENQPGTLTFYINGQKVAQPIPRCFTYQYKNPKSVITTWPIVLEIYNKKYGVRELYNQQLVETMKIYEDKAYALGGQIYFKIEQDSNDSSLTISKPNRPKIMRQKQDLNQSNTNSISNNPFRKSRRQKWQQSKKLDENTKKIQQILKSRTTS